MAEKEIVETSEAEIAVHWKEEELYHPSTKFIGQANLNDPSIFDRFSLDNFPADGGGGFLAPAIPGTFRTIAVLEASNTDFDTPVAHKGICHTFSI